MTSSQELAALEQLGEGREAEVFAWVGGRALRLFRDGFARSVEHDRLAIAAARDGRVPPRLGELVPIAEREGVVLDRVDGETQLDLIGRKPWILLPEARRTGRLHARLHTTIAAPEGLPSLWEQVCERIGRAGALARLAAPAHKALAALPSASQLCHGDYHPSNSSSRPPAGTS